MLLFTNKEHLWLPLKKDLCYPWTACFLCAPPLPPQSLCPYRSFLLWRPHLKSLVPCFMPLTLLIFVVAQAELWVLSIFLRPTPEKLGFPGGFASSLTENSVLHVDFWWSQLEKAWCPHFWLQPPLNILVDPRCYFFCCGHPWEACNPLLFCSSL